MRHRLKGNHLSRKTAHRKSLLSNLACELITHKRIVTTLAKAKALRVYVEPILTKAKNDTTHQRRIVFSYLQDKEAVKELFGAVSIKIAERPGGYTRIIKLGKRLGDNAETALIELVDYNETYMKGTSAKEETRRTRRGRGGKKKSATEATATANAPVEKKEENEDKVTEPTDENKEPVAAESTEEKKSEASAKENNEEAPEEEKKTDEKKTEND